MRTSPAPHASASRRALCSLLVVVAIASLITTCGVAPSDELGLSPGDSWFEMLDEISVDSVAATNLSDEVLAIADAPTAWLELPPEEWRRTRDVSAQERRTFRLSEGAAIWKARKKVPFLITRETAALRESDVRLEPYGQMEGAVTMSHLLHWWDGERELLILTGTVNETIIAISHEAPSLAIAPEVGRAVFQYDVGEDVIEASQLARSADLELVQRRALLAPAPSRMGLAVDRFDGNSLEFAVGVMEHGFAVEDGVVLKRDGQSDGVTFAIDVETGDNIARVWEEHVMAGTGWHEHLVDLSSYTGRAVRISLVTEPGPFDNADFDYGFWSELRVRGKTSAPDRPHIVLLHLDTLRSDRLGTYGYDLATSPALDAWAADKAVVFEDSIVDGSMTLTSTASLVSGLTQHQHLIGIHPHVITPTHEPIAKLLSDVGYETYAMSEGVYICPVFGFDTGFDIFDWSTRGDPNWQQALTWLDTARSGRPTFTFLQTYLVHHPFGKDDERLGPGPGDAYDGWMSDIEVSWASVIGPYAMGRTKLEEADRDYFKRLYDSDVRRLDDVLAWLMPELETRFEGEDFLLIITADHGDEHFEHGSVDHGHSLHGEVINVPMIVRFPDREAGRDTRPVAVVDVVPTILDYAGLEIPEYLPGKSMRGPLPDVRTRVARRHDGEWSVQRDGWKLIISDDDVSDERIQRVVHENVTVASETPEGGGRALAMRGALVDVQLYDLRADPGEFDNLAQAHPERIAELLEALAEYVTAYPRPTQLDEMDVQGLDMDSLDADTLKGLRDMGYLDK